MRLKGKTGQTREDGKKTGGMAFNLDVPQSEVEKIVKGILEQSPNKLAQMMFAYGLTSNAQNEVGYTIPGSAEWKEDGEVPLHPWTAQDTEDYLLALKTYNDLPTQRGGMSIEDRQAKWDEKAEMVKSAGLDPVVILGKRPEAKK